MKSLFSLSGIHAIADGQYGSTGKGLLASFLAENAVKIGHTRWGGSMCSNGPNSGHTFHHAGNKHVLKQLPCFGVAMHLFGHTIPIYLTAGAVIDPQILAEEMARYPDIPVFVHPNAVILQPADREAERTGSISRAAGTRSGTGAAIIRKILREQGAIANEYEGWKNAGMRFYNPVEIDHKRKPYFLEVAQGFSLGVNQRFYPKCTSRECTVSQGLSDASLPPGSIRRTYLSYRTYPIRVGNVDGYDSGGWYPDQREVDWESLGVEPERTTVTNRIRRVATFSWQQFFESQRANEPDWVFLNFLNYLDSPQCRRFIHDHVLVREKWKNAGYESYEFIAGFGEQNSDVQLHLEP